MRLTPWIAAGGLLAIGGCFDDKSYQDSRTRGDLGRGSFVYGCYNDSDTSCDDAGTDLPKAVAVGSRFDVRFAINSGPTPSVISPAPDFVRRVDEAFEVRQAGEFALLAVNGNREVIDIKHLRAAEIDQIRVQRKSELPSANLTLAAKESVQLLALPFDHGGVKLGGALTYAWTSSDERLLTVESLPQLNRVRVRAGANSGKAVLHVELAAATYDVQVQIGDGSTADLDAGAPGDDASTDASADGAAADATQTDAADASTDAGTDAQGGDV